MVRYIAEDDDNDLTVHDQKPSAYIVLLSNGRVSQSFPVRGEVTMGRDKTNGIVVSDQRVSRHHARLKAVDDTYILSDLGSANGTYLNGVLIQQPCRLRDKDRISIGDTKFIFTDSVVDPGTLNQSSFFESKPVPVLPSAEPSPSTTPSWILVGCLGLVIIGLLVALAGLLGLFVGQGQLDGIILTRILWLF